MKVLCRLIAFLRVFRLGFRVSEYRDPKEERPMNVFDWQ